MLSCHCTAPIQYERQQAEVHISTEVDEDGDNRVSCPRAVRSRSQNLWDKAKKVVSLQKLQKLYSISLGVLHFLDIPATVLGQLE